MKTRMSFIGATVALTALAGVLCAQQNNTTTTALTDADKSYLMEDASGSVYDFQMAELAVESARDNATQSYALRLLDDHAKLNKDLLLLARRKDIIVPVTLADDDKTKLMTLEGQHGADFDRAYIAEAIRINSDDVEKANKELNATTDPDIRKTVGMFLKTEQKHLDEARALQAKMTAGK